MNRLKT